MPPQFHILQTFTKALSEVRNRDRRQHVHPKALRWAALKNTGAGNLTANQITALREITASE